MDGNSDMLSRMSLLEGEDDPFDIHYVEDVLTDYYLAPNCSIGFNSEEFGGIYTHL